MVSESIQQNIYEKLINSFYQFEARLNGDKQSVFHHERRKAFEIFRKNGLPGHKDEEYKYTSIAKKLESQLTEININYRVDAEKAPNLPFDVNGDMLVFLNGNYSPHHSRIKSDKSILEIIDLKEAIASNTEIITNHLGKYANPEKDAFIAINTALAEQGCVIQIKKNAVIKNPLILVNYVKTKDRELTINTRNLIVAEQNSRSDIIELTLCDSQIHSFENRVSEIVLQENATLQYYDIQQEGKHNYLIDTTQVYQARNSTFTSYTITLHGGLIRNNLNVTIDAEGCETSLFGVYFLDDKDHVDNHTVVDHRKPHSFSNELYKGVLDGESTGIFNGKIYVQPDAQKTNAFQSNKNIVLTDNAKMNTKPQLEIWADDVKCSHGATTGMIDEEQLFYLQSRGIDRDTAKAMLLYAFANDILEKIQIEPLKIFLEKQIQLRLGRTF